MAKALVVDDDTACLLVVEAMLKKIGCGVIAINDGQQVERIVEQESPDIVIIDLFMQERDGLENIIALRRQQPELPIIAISVNEMFLQMACTLGANEMVKKPIHSSDLCERVTALLAPKSFQHTATK